MTTTKLQVSHKDLLRTVPLKDVSTGNKQKRNNLCRKMILREPQQQQQQSRRRQRQQQRNGNKTLVSGSIVSGETLITDDSTTAMDFDSYYSDNESKYGFISSDSTARNVAAAGDYDDDGCHQDSLTVESEQVSAMENGDTAMTNDDNNDVMNVDYPWHFICRQQQLLIDNHDDDVESDSDNDDDSYYCYSDNQEGSSVLIKAQHEDGEYDIDIPQDITILRDIVIPNENNNNDVSTVQDLQQVNQLLKKQLACTETQMDLLLDRLKLAEERACDAMIQNQNLVKEWEQDELNRDGKLRHLKIAMLMSVMIYICGGSPVFMVICVVLYLLADLMSTILL